MACPTAGVTTVDGGTGPGCSGSIGVTLLEGEFEPGVVSKTFDIKTNAVAQNQCNQQFPRINGGLTQGVIGQIIQSCTTQDWAVDQEPVLSSSVRSDLNDDDPSATYAEQSIGPWVPTQLCVPNPANGYPPHACTNDGGAWLSVSNNPEYPGPPIIDPTKCAAAAQALTCGDQLVNGIVVPGPAPQVCELQGGDCRCRCARCNPNGTLVNIGEGSNGTFVLADPKGVMGSRPWAATCAVTVSN